MTYVRVAEDESFEPIELPSEPDGTVLMSTINALYSGAIGLKYRNAQTNTIRGVRLSEGRLFPPEEGWGSIIYFAVFPKAAENTKRKGVDEAYDVPSMAKTKRLEKRKCTDLIVLGLSYKATDQDLREYFERYGSVIMTQVKTDPKTKQSRGYGFVRYNDYESQVRCLSESSHTILDRKVSVKIPDSQQQNLPPARDPSSHKIFVGRTTEDLTPEDLRNYFAKFGSVTDVFVPKPFRSFAFVTFADADIAESLCGEDHIVKGVSVHIGSANPKSDRMARNLTNSNFQQSSSQYAASSASHGGAAHVNHSHMGASPAINGMSPGPNSVPAASGWSPNPGPAGNAAPAIPHNVNSFSGNAGQASYPAQPNPASAQFGQPLMNPQMMAAFAAQWQTMMQNPAALAASFAAAAAAASAASMQPTMPSSAVQMKSEMDSTSSGGWPSAPPPPPGSNNSVDWRKNPQQAAATWWPQQ